MPKRGDLRTVMVIGSGPIVIGQAAEFDYSGSQACRSLREEGIRTVLVNSNPATIQTDVEMADAVYIEPLTVEFLEKVIAKERPDGVLSGMGGQTGLNLSSELAETGVLKKYDVELLGTRLEAIVAGENREAFADLMRTIGEPIPRSRAVTTVEEARAFVEDLGGLPVIVRAAYTLGGTGSGIARHSEDLERIVSIGLAYSRIKQVLVEESVEGWEEFEYEVMRDAADNCITICSMENVDPMGLHTGESIVVAPAQTLSDVDHQTLRSAALRIIRALGVEGGCNIQFAVHPKTGEYRVIEVNPRVSRSSALASKATGYPIARIAAKIAIGLRLDEIPNPVTGKTLASFEPTLDYIVTKIPRWPFDKFPTVDRRIGTSMKSTGEVMAIGRTFEESLLKAVRSLEIDRVGLESLPWTDDALLRELREPTDQRLFAIAEAFRRGIPLEKVAALTHWDPFFLEKIRSLVDFESRLRGRRRSRALVAEAKRLGFADEVIAAFGTGTEETVRRARPRVAYKMVDTCGGEFEAQTPYYYSTYEPTGESRPIAGRKVLIVGGGPIRIGQGVEFDYCCVQGIFALREEGVGAIIANNNPETVSTDFDISSRLYFEPLILEDILNIIEEERPEGVILQFGGQTSINLAVPLAKALARRKSRTRILGTPPASIDLAEDRRKFAALMRRLRILQPDAASGYSFEEVRQLAGRIGYPVLVRPSYVLGGRGMEIVHSEDDLARFMEAATRVSKDHPVLVDRYLAHATEIDVDVVADGRDVLIGGIQEHIEEAGIHSGDAACVLPAQTLPDPILADIRSVTRRVCKALDVIGLMNLQLAVKDAAVYVLEANPRASRTVPYVSKAIGISLAKVATKVMLGHSLRSLHLVGEPTIDHVAVKAPVFPFQRLPGVDAILGPEMKSTGEVMGIDRSLGRAYYKAMVAAGNPLPTSGAVYMTVRDEDKPAILGVASRFVRLGLRIYATRGTAQFLREHGVEATTVYRISENQSPDALGLMRRGEIRLVINTPTNSTGARRDGYMMRRLAVDLNIPFISTIQAAEASAEAIEAFRSGELDVVPLGSFASTMRVASARL
ncbi:MAG: carbamoyl-phosphate synthase large subunit [Methanobacteriota archaeon]|nr:MAG: carbamoyl-phosphate synthase large subunit [Euryarchaeota archaeon]